MIPWNETNISIQRAQTSADAKFQPKVIRNSNPHVPINPHPGVCRICPKMLWMHYLVGVSHFAKYGTSWPLIVWEMLTNVKKIPYSAMMNKMKKWSGIRIRIQIINLNKLIASRGSPLVHTFQVWSTSVSAFVSYPVYRMTDRTIT